ncbi:uncharacterized protein LOC120906524 [Anopheles arabiensis]|uniref:uncharacterized protein LOC120905848 n=1 Tax=Anopheles arabiensis TaxID=7173 RepID=UPI001AACD5A5|nr:uncharacterized protein LOC120905848 [Anopheles arabiensis]XP_040174202.1 uncharacterized protein LOC120906524 [Anopheles arabiensis]
MATTPEKELSAFELGDLYVSIPLHQWAAEEATEPGSDLISFVQKRDEQKVAQDQKEEELVEDQSKIKKALEDAMSDIVERDESEDISGEPIAESDKLEALEKILEEANSVDEDHVEQETTHDEAHDEAIVEASEDAAEGVDRCARVEV